MAAGTQVKPLTLTERINRIEVSATLAVVNEADKLRSAGADLVDFGAGEPHFKTPQHIKDAAIAAIHADFTKYTPVGGTAELRDAIVARHAQDFGSQYKREEAVAATGGKQALFNAVQCEDISLSTRSAGRGRYIERLYDNCRSNCDSGCQLH